MNKYFKKNCLMNIHNVKKRKIDYMMQDVKSANNCIYKCITSHYESPSYISHYEIIKNLFL